MDTAALVKKVRKIELKTRALSSQIFAGEYHSAFKGKGMQFDQVRAYAPGDDVRSIDWNVSARLNEPYVKVFREERELNLILVIDISASCDFGTRGMLKRDLITELAAVLSWSALSNNDQTGVVFFSDRVEKLIAPAKGKVHTLRLISDLIQTRAKHPGTNLASAFEYLGRILKKRSTIFILSDFTCSGYQVSLNVLAKKHDIKAIRVYDERERQIKPLGLIHLKDNETGALSLIDSADTVLRRSYFQAWNTRSAAIHLSLNRAGVPLLDLKTNEPYIAHLMKLLKGVSRRA